MNASLLTLLDDYNALSRRNVIRRDIPDYVVKKIPVKILFICQQNRLSKEEAGELSCWENTVNRIFQSNRSNIMLEYTATVELDNVEIQKKYADKIIYQYTLKEFREDKYSKEVRILQSDISTKDRVLQAVVLSQYRRKVAEKDEDLQNARLFYNWPGSVGNLRSFLEF